MHRKNWFIGGILLGFLFALALPMTVLAVTGQTLTLSDVKTVLYVDGMRITPRDAAGTEVEPFVAEGTTYLPIRAVADALNCKVDWSMEDGESIVRITGRKNRHIVAYGEAGLYLVYDDGGDSLQLSGCITTTPLYWGSQILDTEGYSIGQYAVLVDRNPQHVYSPWLGGGRLERIDSAGETLEVVFDPNADPAHPAPFQMTEIVSYDADTVAFLYRKDTGRQHFDRYWLSFDRASGHVTVTGYWPEQLAGLEMPEDKARIEAMLQAEIDRWEEAQGDSLPEDHNPN